MGAILANTSWLAVIVGLVLCMVLGFLWYNPKSPTGKIWADSVGVTPSNDMPAMGMVFNTVGLLLAAIFVGAVGVHASILAILAYGVLTCAGYVFAGKPATVGLVHMGYWFGAMILVTLAHHFL